MLSFQEGYMGKLKLKNRIVYPPMCMYQADEAGMVQDFHLIHYGTAAMGGVGLVIIEATAVVPEGRISDHDLGIWSDDHIEGLRHLVEVIHQFGAKAGIQLAHAGRKCEATVEEITAPSAIAFDGESRTPKELDEEGIAKVIEAFKKGAERAGKAGFDLIELHGAHGYLLNEFLSPLTNQRKDNYGGSRENRVRLIQEVTKEVKEVIPQDMVLNLRVSATDAKEGGVDIDEMVAMVDLMKQDFDVIHVSTGGVVPDAKMKIFPGYQVNYANEIKHRCQVPTIAVGLIQSMDQAEDILGSDRADFVAMGRLLLRKPFYLLNNRDESVEIHEAITRGFRDYKRKK